MWLRGTHIHAGGRPPLSLSNPPANYLRFASAPRLGEPTMVGFVTPEHGQRRGRGCGAGLFVRGRIDDANIQTEDRMDGPAAVAYFRPPSAKFDFGGLYPPSAGDAPSPRQAGN